LIFVGIDWAEAHHDVCVLDRDGIVLGRRRVVDGVAGVGEIHALLAEHIEDPSEVVIGVEVDRGLLVQALVSAGYQVIAVNPLASSRYRERHAVSGAKSDRGDAKVLADLVRTDRHNHRPVAGDSELAEAVKILARAHQSAIWSRQRQLNSLRSALREFSPAALEAFGTDLATPDAVAVLSIARLPSLAADCPNQRSPPPSDGPVGNATSTSGPSKSKPPCALPSSPLRRSSATPTAWSPARPSPSSSA
jgi:transposase